MTNAIEVYEGQAVPAGPPALFGTDDPVGVVRRATAIAQPLAGVIEQQRLYVEISGRRHVLVTGWTLLGSMLGVFPITAWCRPVEYAGVHGWEARVEARTLGGALVGAAEAQCMSNERNWQDKDDFTLRSMAQTRATSKALRMPLGFVIALAGYETAPAEEMEAFESTATARQPQQGRARPARGAASADGAVLPATEPQVKALYAIGKAAAGLSEEQLEDQCVQLFGVLPPALNRRQASDFIDALKAERPGAQTPTS